MSGASTIAIPPPDMEDADESEEEEFLDFDEDQQPTSTSMEAAIDAATCAMDLFLSNNFASSREIVAQEKNSSVYHALGFGTFAFMQAVMTMNSADIADASQCLKSAVQVCSKWRRKETVKEAVTKIIKRRPVLTEDQRHAELCYAEAILEKAVLTFLEDETLASFLKGALQLRHGYFSYKECWNILKKQNPDWKSEKLKREFESGVRLGVGAFNLLISMLPGRVLKLLEWIGFSGTKEVGLALLEKSYAHSPGAIRSTLSALALLVYHTFVCFFAGTGDGDVDKARKIVGSLLERFPNGAFSLFFSARVELVSGNVETAVREYQKSIDSQREWVQFHHFCLWELMWCHVFTLNWDKSADCALRLLNESKWSQCFYAYARAACLMMKPDKSQEELEEIEVLMREVPKWKQRIAGKSIPIEKFSVKKSEKFFNSGKTLVLPAFELMFVWNGFTILAKRRDLLEKIYAEILAAKEKVADDEESLCLCQLLAGCCLRWMQLPTLAEECLEEALKLRVTEDRYLHPYAAVELGYLYLSLGDTGKAKKQLEFARSSYSDYSLESRLHFRIHAALNKVAELEKAGGDGK